MPNKKFGREVWKGYFSKCGQISGGNAKTMKQCLRVAKRYSSNGRTKSIREIKSNIHLTRLKMIRSRLERIEEDIQKLQKLKNRYLRELNTYKN